MKRMIKMVKLPFFFVLNRKYFVVLFVLFFSNLFSVEKKHVISLGPNCITAGFLQAYGLRIEAFPFDWTIIPFEGVCQAFADDFLYYMDPMFLHHHGSGIYNSFYKIRFNHDFPLNAEATGVVPDFLDHLESVKEKYDRRIERLRAILNSGDQVYLFAGVDRNLLDFRELLFGLQQLLITKFPSLDFTIAVYGGEDAAQADLGIDRVRYFRIEDLSELSRQGRHAEVVLHPQWGRILNSLNLK